MSDEAKSWYPTSAPWARYQTEAEAKIHAKVDDAGVRRSEKAPNSVLVWQEDEAGNQYGFFEDGSKSTHQYWSSKDGALPNRFFNCSGIGYHHGGRPYDHTKRPEPEPIKSYAVDFLGEMYTEGVRYASEGDAILHASRFPSNTKVTPSTREPNHRLTRTFDGQFVTFICIDAIRSYVVNHFPNASVRYKTEKEARLHADRFDDNSIGFSGQEPNYCLTWGVLPDGEEVSSYGEEDCQTVYSSQEGVLPKRFWNFSELSSPSLSGAITTPPPPSPADLKPIKSYGCGNLWFRTEEEAARVLGNTECKASKTEEPGFRIQWTDGDGKKRDSWEGATPGSEISRFTLIPVTDSVETSEGLSFDVWDLTFEGETYTFGSKREVDYLVAPGRTMARAQVAKRVSSRPATHRFYWRVEEYIVGSSHTSLPLGGEPLLQIRKSAFVLDDIPDDSLPTEWVGLPVVDAVSWTTDGYYGTISFSTKEEAEMWRASRKIPSSEPKMAHKPPTHLLHWRELTPENTYVSVFSGAGLLPKEGASFEYVGALYYTPTSIKDYQPRWVKTQPPPTVMLSAKTAEELTEQVENTLAGRKDPHDLVVDALTKVNIEGEVEKAVQGWVDQFTGAAPKEEVAYRNSWTIFRTEDEANLWRARFGRPGDSISVEPIGSRKYHSTHWVENGQWFASGYGLLPQKGQNGEYPITYTQWQDDSPVSGKGIWPPITDLHEGMAFRAKQEGVISKAALEAANRSEREADRVISTNVITLNIVGDQTKLADVVSELLTPPVPTPEPVKEPVEEEPASNTFLGVMGILTLLGSMSTLSKKPSRVLPAAAAPVEVPEEVGVVEEAEEKVSHGNG